MSRSTVKDPAKSKSSETFFKVLRFIGRYRFLLILSIILAAVSVILQLYVPILFGNAIDQVIAQHQVKLRNDVVLSVTYSCNGHPLFCCHMAYECDQ